MNNQAPPRILADQGRPAERLFGPLITAAVYVVLTAAVLVPVLAVQVPCLGDYLNHLARIHILTTIGSSPALQNFYEYHSRLMPYFGMDIPVAVLAQVMPIYDAGRLFVGLCVVMPVLAAATLHFAVYRRVSLAPALGFLVSYNYLLERGFLAYIFSASLAVILFAGWVATTRWRRWPRAALFAAGALLLYLGHPFAFAAYGILVGGYELGKAVRSDERRIGAAADIAAAAIQAMPALTLVVLAQANSGLSGGNLFQYGSIWERPLVMISPLHFPSGPLVTIAYMAVPVLCLALLPLARLAPSVWPGLLAVVVVACCAPRWLFGVWGADFRLPFVAAIVLIGGLSRGPRLGRASAVAVLAIVMSMVLARSAGSLATLRQLDGQVAKVRKAVDTLPVGARLLVVDDAPLRRIPIEVMTGHIGLVAAIDRDALVPFLFTGVTALQLRYEFRHSASPNARAVTSNELWDGFSRRDPPEGPPPSGNGGIKYWLGWTEKFDYVLVIHFGMDIALPAVLQKVAGTDVANLYKVAAP